MMELEVGFHYLSMTLEVLLLDLLLSSDNIVMIALACGALPQDKRKLGLVLGTGAAILLRVLLTTVARFVLEIPVLKLLGGIALVVIAIKLIRAAETSSAVPQEQGGGGTSLWSAVTTIVVADLVMSVDNVLGLAAIARGSVLILVLGLAFSVPVLMFGSLFVGELLKRYPILIRAGGAMLGWFAGGIAVSEPLFSQWIAVQAPALSVVVPLLTAAYVLAQVGVMRGTQSGAAALRPLPRASVTVGRMAMPNPVPGPRPCLVTPQLSGAADIQPKQPLPTGSPVRRLRWPDRADWWLYERWSIASLGATGLLMFAVRPSPALTAVLGVVAVLGMTLAPFAHATVRRKR